MVKTGVTRSLTRMCRHAHNAPSDTCCNPSHAREQTMSVPTLNSRLLPTTLLHGIPSHLTPSHTGLLALDDDRIQQSCCLQGAVLVSDGGWGHARGKGVGELQGAGKQVNKQGRGG
jgi:hypothetical protein